MHPLNSRWGLSLCAFSAALFVFTPASAGEITRSNPNADFEWKSTECFLPTPPPATSHQSSSDRLTKYALDIELYIECIQKEAQRDFAKAQEEMHRAVERNLEDKTNVMNEKMLRAAKTMR